MIETISAVTLSTRDMDQAVDFYLRLGFRLHRSTKTNSFTTFRLGTTFLNLAATLSSESWVGWGRLIFYVSDVDEVYANMRRHGIQPDFDPRDADWGERYFHVTDPDGHEISFAAPLP